MITITQTQTETHTLVPFSLSSSSHVTVETKNGNIIDLTVANQLPAGQKLKLKTWLAWSTAGASESATG